MKTVVNTKTGVVERISDFVAKNVVNHRSGNWQYCDKSTWKRLVRDRDKSLPISEELKRPSSLPVN